MTRYLIRFLLIAGAFYYVFPMIPGIHFHGNFVHALVVGVLFTVLGWVVELFVIAITTILTISTFGMALLVLIPVWLLGFWLFPAIVLRFLADMMPTSLSFTGWEPAIWGGLIMLLIGLVTSRDLAHRRRRCLAGAD